MFKIAICDDEAATVYYYEEQLKKLFHKMNIKYSIDLFTDSAKLLSNLYGKRRWDIFFLDIDMPLVNGLSLGRKIRELDQSCYIIYVSIHKEHVYESFETKPFRFIPKDEFSARIESCITALLADSKAESESDYVLFQNRTSMYRYRILDIIYAQSLDKYITLFLVKNQQTDAIRYKMSDLESQLKKHGFIRVHKSYLVNYRYIKSIHSTGILLDDGRNIPISRTRLDEIKAEFRRLTL